MKKKRIKKCRCKLCKEREFWADLEKEMFTKGQ